MQLFIFAFATTLEVRNADIAVHDRDAGRWSHEFVARVAAADFVNEVHTVHSRDELRALIDERKVIAAIDMGPDFSRDIAAGRPPPFRSSLTAGAAMPARSRSLTSTPSLPTLALPPAGIRVTRPLSSYATGSIPT